ncbi:MAG: hypothetical protein QM536_00015 [Chitinophagaceae bacterium]|nr:hypothetical protein [Chitinophagaceae bacterium]
MKLKNILLLLISFSYTLVYSQAEKHIQKQFSVSGKTTQFSIKNKFGKVVITTWEKNEIFVKVAMIVDRKDGNAKKAEEMLRNIEIDIQESPGSIQFETKINTSKKNDLEINYEVKMPPYLPLRIENSFGDAYISSYDGQVDLIIGYGHIRAENFTNTCNVRLSFGSGEIQKVKNGEFKIKYSDLEIKTLGNALIDQSFSDVNIDEVENMNIKANYGNTTIHSIYSIDGELSFNDFKSSVVTNSLNVNIRYGDFKVEKIKKNCSVAKIDSKFADVILGIEKGMDAQFESQTSFCDISVDDGKADVDMYYKVKTSNSTHYKGKIGRGGDKIIKINSSYGDVNIKIVEK